MLLAPACSTETTKPLLCVKVGPVQPFEAFKAECFWDIFPVNGNKVFFAAVNVINRAAAHAAYQGQMILNELLLFFGIFSQVNISSTFQRFLVVGGGFSLHSVSLDKDCMSKHCVLFCDWY